MRPLSLSLKTETYLAQVEHVEELAAGVRGVAGATQHGLQTDEVLLAHGARLAVILFRGRVAHERSAEFERRTFRHRRQFVRYPCAETQMQHARDAHPNPTKSHCKVRRCRCLGVWRRRVGTQAGIAVRSVPHMKRQRRGEGGDLEQ